MSHRSLKKVCSSITKAELTKKRPRCLRQISFSVPSIHNFTAERQCDKKSEECGCTTTSTPQASKTTVILEVDSSYPVHISDCEDFRASSDYCLATSPESAMRIFNKFSCKQKATEPRVCQSEPRFKKKPHCCENCDLRIVTFGNYPNEEDKDCLTISSASQTDFCDDFASQAASMSTFNLSSSECDTLSSTRKRLSNCKCTKNVKPECRASPSCSPRPSSCYDYEALKNMVTISFLEEICERLLRELCQPTEKSATPPKKSKKPLASTLPAKRPSQTNDKKLLTHPKLRPPPNKKKCCTNLTPPTGYLVPKICTKICNKNNNVFDLYCYYDNQWKRFHEKILNGNINQRNSVRWSTRGKLIDQEEFAKRPFKRTSSLSDNKKGSIY